MTTPLYVDDAGRVITTHSMIKAMGRCPKQTQYKYAERLKPRFVTSSDKPLKRGTWFHELLEDYYVGKSWKLRHKQNSARYGELFDEERDALGDLPYEMEALMRSYLWHYGADKDDPFHGWTVHDTELTLECEWPDGEGIYRCRVDALIENQYGLWIVDHKTHKKLPDHSFRLLDHASALYIWCAKMNGLDVNGFIWNYIVAKAPTKPQLVDVKRSPRLSRSAIDTDYPTMLRAIKEYGLDWRDYRDQLRALKNTRWKDGEVQTSNFFRREVMEKDDDMLARVVGAAMRTRDRMHGYHWEDPDTVERVTDRSCNWMCSYKELCMTELLNGDARNMRKQHFRVGDPLDYYQDTKDPES